MFTTLARRSLETENNPFFYYAFYLHFSPSGDMKEVSHNILSKNQSQAGRQPSTFSCLMWTNLSFYSLRIFAFWSFYHPRQLFDELPNSPHFSVLVKPNETVYVAFYLPSPFFTHYFFHDLEYNPMMLARLHSSFPLPTEAKWDTERPSDLPKVTQLVRRESWHS